MKKTFLFFTLLIAIVTTMNSQSISNDDSFINIGLGLSSYYTSGIGFKTKIPPIEASYEKMVSENISVGAFIGMYKAELSTITYDYLNVGAIGNYHFVNNNKFNVYAGARLGYLNASAGAGAKGLNFSLSGIFYALQIGARYFVSDKFAINTEFGYGIALLKIGISFKL